MANDPQPPKNTRSYKLHPLFKTAMALVIVIGPIYWLMFTNDGQRRVDAVMLSLFGAESMALDLHILDPRFSEPELREVYPDLDWNCVDAPGEYGDRACASAIGNYNSIPARRVRFHFASGQLTVMQVDYRNRYHGQLLGQLGDQLGAPDRASTGGVHGVLQWTLRGGLVVAKTELNPGDEAALIWIAARPKRPNDAATPAVAPQ